MRVLILASMIAFACAIAAGLTRAAPPEGADPALAPWFNSLERPDVGGSCCDVADCRGVDDRVRDGHYEVYIAQPDFPIEMPAWVAVPAEKILPPRTNPIGRAVVCWMPHLGVLCFVRGTEI